MSMTTLLQFILTCLLVIDDVFAEQVIVAENYGGAQHRQALLEPHQLFPEALWAGHLHTQPGSRSIKSINRRTEGGKVSPGNLKVDLEIELK